MKINDELSEFLDVLDQYRTKLGISIFTKYPEIETILSADETTRRLWSEEELGHYSYSLQGYACYIQREINEEHIKLNWAKHNFRVISGKYCAGYGTQYTKYEERVDMMIADNEGARALDEIILNAESRIKLLDFIGQRISNMANSLTELQKTKRAVHYER